MKKERLETLSDGVIAIILTLMILEIKLPVLDRENLLRIFKEVAVYAFSFTIIAIMWLNYNSFFILVEKINTKIIWLNLLLLFLMSLIPLPTKSLGDDFSNPKSHLLYGVILTAACVIYSLLQTEANKFIHHIDAKGKRLLNRKNWIAVILYALSIPLSFISIYLSAFIFIINPVCYFIPSKLLTSAK